MIIHTAFAIKFIAKTSNILTNDSPEVEILTDTIFRDLTMEKIPNPITAGVKANIKETMKKIFEAELQEAYPNIKIEYMHIAMIDLETLNINDSETIN